jgi:LAS superfamily LD-carboxypeptidase LdcB
MTNTNNTQPDDATDKAMLSVTLDHALYERYLDESDLSEEQKQEFLQTLWNIIVSFVDLGFEVHPLQQAQEQLQPVIENNSSDKCTVSHDKDSQDTHNLLRQYGAKMNAETKNTQDGST